MIRWRCAIRSTSSSVRCSRASRSRTAGCRANPRGRSSGTKEGEVGVFAHQDRSIDMLTRRALTELSRAHAEELVLSVYIARDGSDPGARGAWRLRLDGALGAIRAEIEREKGDLAPFDG